MWNIAATIKINPSFEWLLQVDLSCRYPVIWFKDAITLFYIREEETISAYGIATFAAARKTSDYYTAARKFHER